MQLKKCPVPLPPCYQWPGGGGGGGCLRTDPWWPSPEDKRRNQRPPLDPWPLLSTPLPTALPWLAWRYSAPRFRHQRDPDSPADAGGSADGAVGRGGRGGSRSRTEALARLHKPGGRGGGIGEGWGRKTCEVRRRGRGERSRGEGGKRRQARGAVPWGGRHRVSVVLLADAVEHLTCIRRRRRVTEDGGAELVSLH